VAFDMGCYEVLPATTATAAGAGIMQRDSGSSGRDVIPLWGYDLGLRLVEQYQQYLQELLQQQPGVSSGNDSTRFSPPSDDGFASAAGGVRSGQSDQHSALFSTDDEHPYMLASYLCTLSQARPPSESQEQLGHLQRHFLHGDQHMQDEELASTDLEEQQQRAHGHKGLGGGIRRLTHGLLGIGVLQQQQQQQQQHTVAMRSNSLVPQPGTVKSMRRTSLGSTAGSSTEASAGPRIPAALPTVRLYQVVAPALAGRAAVFGSHLALQRTWHCIDAPYFSAPGASGLTAPAGPLQLPAPQAMPSQAHTAAAPGEPTIIVPGNTDPSCVVGTPSLAATPSAATPATQPAAHSSSPFAAAAATSTAAAPAHDEGNTDANGHLQQQQQQQTDQQTNPARALSAPSAVDGAAFAANSPPTAAATAGAARPSMVRPVLPVVTVVFVSVDGVPQLAAHPDLAR
jgi:hypothetical protein